VVELTLGEREALISKISKDSLSARANLKARIELLPNVWTVSGVN